MTFRVCETSRLTLRETTLEDAVSERAEAKVN
jgi:hypothetical protein